MGLHGLLQGWLYLFLFPGIRTLLTMFPFLMSRTDFLSAQTYLPRVLQFLLFCCAPVLRYDTIVLNATAQDIDGERLNNAFSPA
jgi:hypothetical protein